MMKRHDVCHGDADGLFDLILEIDEALGDSLADHIRPSETQ